MLPRSLRSDFAKLDRSRLRRVRNNRRRHALRSQRLPRGLGGNPESSDITITEYRS